MSGKVVCVTGASGYIASWLVKLLLERGYTVRGTVRDPDDPKKTEHLMALEGASERLHLFKANLVEEGSFDAVIDGCEGVFHTASPIASVKTDPEAELVEPALKGTLNVLGSCAKSSSVKRIVVTSSMATLYNNERPKTSEVTLDETWFSSVELCKENKLWYDLSKILAEEAAWKFAKENGLDLVTMHPALVIGPLLQPSLNASCGLVLSMISGSPVFPNYTLGYVNVKDVALAHILAFENPSATGRYCLVERVEHLSKLVKHIHDLYPELQLPEKCSDEKPYLPEYNVSKEKVKSLGMNLIPLEVSLKETIESLVEKNFTKL